MIQHRSTPRRGRIVDRARLGWLHTQPCLAAGKGCSGRITVHHVKECPGAMKDDTRAVPLCLAHHLHDFGPLSIERLGRKYFERHFGLDLEVEIRRLSEQWESQKQAAA